MAFFKPSPENQVENRGDIGASPETQLIDKKETFLNKKYVAQTTLNAELGALPKKPAAQRRADGAGDAVFSPGTEASDFILATKGNREALQRLSTCDAYSDLKLASVLKQILAVILNLRESPEKKALSDQLIEQIVAKLENIQERKEFLAYTDPSNYQSFKQESIQELESIVSRQGRLGWMTASHAASKTSSQEDPTTQKIATSENNLTF